MSALPDAFFTLAAAIEAEAASYTALPMYKHVAEQEQYRRDRYLWACAMQAGTLLFAAVEHGHFAAYPQLDRIIRFYLAQVPQAVNPSWLAGRCFEAVRTRWLERITRHFGVPSGPELVTWYAWAVRMLGQHLLAEHDPDPREELRLRLHAPRHTKPRPRSRSSATLAIASKRSVRLWISHATRTINTRRRSPVRRYLQQVLNKRFVRLS